MLAGAVCGQLVAETVPPAAFELAGPWRVTVTVPAAEAGRPAVIASLDVPPPQPVAVVDEVWDSLPVFNPQAAGWVKGVALRGVQAQETTTPGLLDEGSVVVKLAGEAASPKLERGKDYQFDGHWGTLGRLESGAIKAGHAVAISYRYTPLRLDDVVLDAAGVVRLRVGTPMAAAPVPSPLAEGERLLGRIWLPGPVEKLEPRHLFPLLEMAYPEPPKPSPTVAEARLPKTLAKLQKGETVRILAWGDSVTESTYLPHRERDAWQHQFRNRLSRRFPQAKIELITEGWGGRTTAAYLAEPPGSPRHYQTKVLGVKPDLVVSEFVNDAGLPSGYVAEKYAQIFKGFEAIGAEWIILTPHYVRPDWMGLDRERDIDDDPRPYVKELRQFAQHYPVALAEGALRYGRLWRQALPYTTLMLNSINHPDARGMAMFADALMELFP